MFCLKVGGLDMKVVVLVVAWSMLGTRKSVLNVIEGGLGMSLTYAAQTM